MGADDRDTALLLDMLRYAEEAAGLVKGMHYEGYLTERMRILALERTVEIVGEAAAQISEGRKEAIADIPWRQIRGQRNALAHRYGKIDQFQLFKTASEDLPRLIAVLRKILR
jgi:uncharacterized protein with HEPN domain